MLLEDVYLVRDISADKVGPDPQVEVPVIDEIVLGGRPGLYDARRMMIGFGESELFPFGQATSAWLAAKTLEERFSITLRLIEILMEIEQST